MKKHKLKQKIIDELADNPIVSLVCDKFNFSRQTFYRWRNEDKDFSQKVDESTFLGQEKINDLAESKLVKKIKEEHWQAIKYRLDNRKVEYMKPRPKDFFDRLLPKETGGEVHLIINSRGKNPEIMDFSEEKKETTRDSAKNIIEFEDYISEE